MRGWQVQDVDLTGRGEVLGRLDPAGALFLGCRLSPTDDDELRRRGALVFPAVPDVPFDAYRVGLYTADELYAGIEDGYDATPDARIYAWSTRAHEVRTGGTSVHDSIAMALHDNAIDDALAEHVGDARVVGVMGGHAVERGGPDYAAAARLGADLAGLGLTVATGGGPGAMEAANLGASLAQPGALTEALAALAGVPSYRPSVTAWARRGLAVRERLGDGDAAASLGVPTWFYGHEPPNPFCGRIAKYFRNAIREDVLLRLCRAGIVFLPGAAGTVQEVFQSACENYYADPASVAPMVLVGRRFWTEEVPAWPLLRSLALGRPLEGHVHLVDGTDEVAAALGQQA
ncbi:MAG: LOG family protein [Marmoricola sp.]